MCRTCVYAHITNLHTSAPVKFLRHLPALRALSCCCTVGSCLKSGYHTASAAAASAEDGLSGNAASAACCAKPPPVSQCDHNPQKHIKGSSCFCASCLFLNTPTALNKCSRPRHLQQAEGKMPNISCKQPNGGYGCTTRVTEQVRQNSLLHDPA